ncbi:MAG: Heat-inducible transcription repressor hrcA [candidate division WWE3 bacterium GW2011_GWB2_43_22]|uniref:Heat-inducible transcription repressor hrcA n=1 Tax=candidate division WWE3 bacterium GW2011_GWB2_43_22 TaxID=1619118 RepID=A0A0G1HMH5_UNCKA|nr:MAG: Heat-inducible transcription repressor hrcA [candidate division WWE3 bacterium GW2011_GWB2_43_22]
MLSDRQFQLIHAVIDEYIKNAEPVGSVEIVAKYNLRCSPATVRNEMAKLIELGFLEMMHTSSGRVPTKMAYRLYLDQMMEERELPVLQEVALKQRLWTNRFEFEKLLRESVLALSEMSRSLAFATTEDGFVSYAGAANILDHKEFWEVLDNAANQGDIKTLIEEEIGIEKLNRCAMVFTEYSAGKRSGKIGVIGPSRISYPEIIPSVKYTKRLVEELGGSW